MVGTPLLYRLPPPDISGPPTNEMFGRTPYERSRFARSARSFIILTNGAHSSESFVTWETNFGEFKQASKHTARELSCLVSAGITRTAAI